MTVWVCPYCGAENFLDDRVGGDEPKCIGCRHERKTPAQVQKEIDKDITDLKIEMKDLRLRMEPHLEMIASLEEDLSQERSSLKELKEEFNECKHEVKQLEAQIVYTSHDKEMAAMKNQSQTLLKRFLKGMGF
jgi:chromosome segregation ATPase